MNLSFLHKYMGLDGIELVLAIEDEFRITITDDEAVDCTTPAKLTDLVYAKLGNAESEICPSQHGFYKVRKLLMDQTSIPSSRIKPDTPLDELIGRGNSKNFGSLFYWDYLMGKLLI